MSSDVQTSNLSIYTDHCDQKRSQKSSRELLPALTPSQLARFHEPADPDTPPAIPSWSAALNLVNTSKAQVRKDKEHRLGFGFLDPTILSKASNRKIAVVAWLLSRMSHLTSLFNTNTTSQQGPELTSTHWTNLLYKLMSNLEKLRITPADTPASTPNIVSSAIASNPRKWTPHFSTIFNNALSSTNVYWMDHTFQLGTSEELDAVLTPAFTSGVIWELYKTNFRFELLFLDRTLAPSLWPSEGDHSSIVASAQRDLEVRRVFASEGDEDKGYTLSRIPSRDGGLASPRWQECHQCFIALHHLMKSWEGCPSSLSDFTPTPTESSAQDLERLATQFYCQSFFDMFGRAPVCPHRLPPSVDAGEAPIAPGAAALSTSLAIAFSSDVP
jgi:hypothetical protein